MVCMQAAEGERVARQRLQEASTKLKEEAAKAHSEAEALARQLEDARTQQV